MSHPAAPQSRPVARAFLLWPAPRADVPAPPQTDPLAQAARRKHPAGLHPAVKRRAPCPTSSTRRPLAVLRCRALQAKRQRRGSRPPHAPVAMPASRPLLRLPARACLPVCPAEQKRRCPDSTARRRRRVRAVERSPVPAQPGRTAVPAPVPLPAHCVRRQHSVPVAQWCGNPVRPQADGSPALLPHLRERLVLLHRRLPERAVLARRGRSKTGRPEQSNTTGQGKTARPYLTAKPASTKHQRKVLLAHVQPQPIAIRNHL